MAITNTRTINYDNVNTFTSRRALPKMTDTIFRSNALLRKMYDNGTKLDGGAVIQQHLIYGEGPGGAFDDQETLDTSEAEIATAAFFNWKHYYASATIRRMDELKNNGRAAFARLLTAKLKVMEKSMKNHLGNGLHGSSVGAPKIITGLQDAIAATGVYGNISKAANAWWQSVVTSLAGQSLSMQAIRTMIGALTEDEDFPNMLNGRQNMYDLIYGLIEPQKRFMDDDVAKAGFKNILVEGRPFIVDSKAEENVINYINTDYFDFVTHEDENMRLEPWTKPFGRTSRSAFIFWAGNLTCSNCRFQGKHTNVTQ